MKHKRLLSPVSDLSSLRLSLNRVRSAPVLNTKYAKTGFLNRDGRETNSESTTSATSSTNLPKNDIVFKIIDEDEAARYNTFGIQMIASSLRRKLFSQPSPDLGDKVKHACNAQLKSFGLNEGKRPVTPCIDITLPESMSNLSKFFTGIAEDQLKPYKEFIQGMVDASVLPALPKEWERSPGWTKYDQKGPVSVSHPQCNGLVFDVEVCIHNGNNLPALAVAISPEFVYSWVSPALDKPWLYNRAPSTDLLIPLGNEPKIVVGHHIMYDRARIAEEYSEKRSTLRFLDTQSLHVCVSGLENTQKGQWLGANSRNETLDKDWMKVGSPNSLAAVHKLYCGKDLDKSTRDVFVTGTHSDVQEQFQSLVTYCSSDVVATYNVLRNVWGLYTDRFPSPVTLSGMFEMASCFIPTNKNWQRYINESDSMFYTMQREIQHVLSNLADDALLRYHLDKRKTESDSWMSQLDWSTKKILGVKNKKLSKKLQAEEDARRKEELENPRPTSISDVISNVCSETTLKPKHYLGAPEWYRALCPKASSFHDISWTRSPSEISLSTAIAPMLLKLGCHGHTLYRTHHHGWGFLEPKSVEDAELDQRLVRSFFTDVAILDPISEGNSELAEEDMSLEEYSSQIEDIREQITFISKLDDPPCMFVQHRFKKLSLNASHVGNVGSPLGKSFTDSIESGIITSSGGWEAEQVLTLGTGLTSWRNTRNRILSQFVVQLQESDLVNKEAINKARQDRLGAILPQVVPAGTITRRATETLWLTASNVRADRVGSEFKGVVAPFPGYCFVGADVDSQELWIASLIGDSTYGEHGATPLGWMALQGQKSDGTDMHSKTAAELSQGKPGLVSRNMAKAFNYARIYGSGKGLARNMLRDCCKDLSEEEIRQSIDKMFASTKGNEVHQLTNFGKRQALIHGLHVEELAAHDIANLSAVTGYSRYQLSKTRESRYDGGSESAMFNKLEEIARSDHPVTPFLKCRITRTLEPSVIQKSYQLNSRINWVVQSSAVDFLHLLLVAMKWLMSEYDIPGRFTLSIHDEVRFHVPLEYKYEAALALQVANLLTRSFFSAQLGIHDLPNNVAFFSGVDIDRSLRKSVQHECVTPSNPHGLSVSYGIEPGEELDIFALLERTNVLRARNVNLPTG